jgi:hypothetical protein
MGQWFMRHQMHESNKANNVIRTIQFFLLEKQRRDSTVKEVTEGIVARHEFDRE